MPAKKASTAIKKRPDADTSLANHIEELRAAGKLYEVEASEGAVDEMVDRILNAENVDAILGGTLGAGSLVGRTIVLRWVNFLESDVREGYFSVVGFSEADDLGREQVFTCGSIRMLAQLVALATKGVIGGQDPAAVRVGSASVEFEPGKFGDTYFLSRV